LLTTQQTMDLGAYPYTHDLLALAQATPTQMCPLLPQNLTFINSPLVTASLVNPT